MQVPIQIDQTLKQETRNSNSPYNSSNAVIELFNLSQIFQQFPQVSIVFILQSETNISLQTLTTTAIDVQFLDYLYQRI